MLKISNKNDLLDFVLRQKDEKVSQKTINDFAMYVAKSKQNVTDKDINTYKQLIDKYNEDPFEFSLNKRAVKIFKESILAIVNKGNENNKAAFIELTNNGVPLEKLSDNGNIYNIIKEYAGKKVDNTSRDQLESLSKLGVTNHGETNETGTSKGIGRFEILLSLLVKDAEHPLVGDLKVGDDIYEIKSSVGDNTAKLNSSFKGLSVTTFDAISTIAKEKCGADIEDKDKFNDITRKIVEAASKGEDLAKIIRADILTMIQNQYGHGAVSDADVANINLNNDIEFEYDLFTLQLKAYLKSENAKGIIVFKAETGDYSKIDASSIKVGEKLSHIAIKRPSNSKTHPTFEIKYK